ncbi:MAG: hypothetical protein F4186_15130 [Boseongicola sp. SB0676_bin_33]|uniref:Uncharacterized protein n=1 Tax=Boseongicola sp. SB0664_bin_43 TaxID=2604844 RepID=A0A6B0Y1P3_9RHOB|nr:hypothetical protein [Boseongicola sp. SB0664_bin_43]MYF90527.1 hypothetical protein [Boseongicola sp. SB0676_bin_33]MYK30408.1 hypothetical protein [Boseongicola sp. SB0670_bin_30]
MISIHEASCAAALNSLNGDVRSVGRMPKAALAMPKAALAMPGDLTGARGPAGPGQRRATGHAGCFDSSTQRMACEAGTIVCGARAKGIGRFSGTAAASLDDSAILTASLGAGDGVPMPLEE